MNLIGKFKKIFVAAAVALGALFARATTFVVEPGDDLVATIGQAQDDDVVQIAAGTYIVSAGITIDRAITIRGVHSAVTTIKSTGNAFTVFTLKNSRAVIERVTIRDAVAPTRPAVQITGGGGTLCDAVICNCKATNTGSNTGAVYIDSADAIVRRVVIRDCSGSWGGGLFINKNAIVDCCYLTGNSAQYGGGFYINSGGLNPLIVHLTACENGATYGKDFYNSSGSSVTKIYDSWIKSAGGSGYSGSNNKSGAATTEELVDKGIPIDGMSTTDVNGLAYDTVNPAIGSHALVSDPITVTWLGKTTVGLGTQETAVFSIEGVPEGASVSAALYDPEGVYVGGSDDVSPFDFKASEVLGDYTLIVTVDDQSGSVRDIVKKGVMNASLTEVHVSKTGSGEMPYATEATALTDIQMAIDACAAGGTVIVHDGTYEIKATVCVEKPLTVRSQSGRDKTILVRDASSLARPLYINHAGACVEGFTIRNGKEGSATPKGGSSYGGGVQIGTAGGLLDKCIIENCINGTHGGAIAL